MPFTRVFDILYKQLKEFPQNDALCYKENGQWTRYSTQQVVNYVDSIGAGLKKLGMSHGSKVAIVSTNRPEWNFVDFGCQQIGAVSVPVYPNITASEFEYIFTHSEAEVVFAGNKEIYGKVTEALTNRPHVKVFTFDEVEGATHWKTFVNDITREEINALESDRQAVKPDDLYSIIYTSGTTGTPKGVILTHQNMISDIKGGIPAMPVDENHRALSFLPLSHVYERMLLNIFMSFGVSIYYAENMATISNDLKDIKPHIFTTVPRLLEKVYDKIIKKGYTLKGVKKALFFRAVNLGLKYDTQKNRGALYNWQLKMANKIIFDKWREALGGNLICIVSGGAALQTRLARVFWAAQIPVLQGYGLTEASPCVSVNRISPQDTHLDTVGIVFDNIEVKFGEDGELLVRGGNVMQGYYKEDAQTHETLDADGWLHTGDIGELTDGRFLKITGRKKAMFKNSGGKYVVPQHIENKLKESLMIEQVMVVGESQKYAAALIVPDFESLKDWCKLHNITYTNNADILEDKAVKAKFGKEIKEANTKLQNAEQIKKFALLSEPWTVESGELTPTVKLKRKVVYQNNKEKIESLFPNDGN